MHNLDIRPDTRSGTLNRRRFLTGATTSCILFLLRSTGVSHASDKKKINSHNDRNLIEGEFAVFTSYQATLVEEVSSLIIPSDDSPGAREAGVVFMLDRIAANSKEDQEIYTAGIEWLDYMADTIAGMGSFLDLSHDDKKRILTIADSGKLLLSDKLLLFIQYRNTRVARRFFAMIRQQTIEIFYTSETGWRLLGYKGPPQWSGYHDYYRCS